MIRATPIQFDEIGTSTDEDEMNPIKNLESLAIDIEDTPITPESATHDAPDSNK